ncbi:hypothetical protein CLW00_10827 [Mongoliibacter ruber]|uniref:Uncharacterized protein n=1 Tax=Mongoliibacter ruber TaxID=1750599 RepID=A0A2T0WIK6_9BACT|nr:hypothetical protein CLW00_10827 [Mongoliibacter ruber]
MGETGTFHPYFFILISCFLSNEGIERLSNFPLPVIFRKYLESTNILNLANQIGLLAP